MSKSERIHRDYYEVLGVSEDATYEDDIIMIFNRDDELKKSYRKLALKWHPGIDYSYYCR